MNFLFFFFSLFLNTRLVSSSFLSKKQNFDSFVCSNSEMNSQRKKKKKEYEWNVKINVLV